LPLYFIKEEEMAQAKVNIPYPHISIENPIAYNWGNDDNWAG